MSEHGIDRVSTAELQRLLLAVRRGTIAIPLREAELHAEGFAATEVLAVLGGLSASSLSTVLGAFIADRERRPPPRLDLVWTGPETRIATSRDTAVVVRELFERAERSVLIAGFSFDHGEEIFAALHGVMRSRGVSSDIYLDIRDETSSGAGDDRARAYATWFLGRNWPFGPPFPTLYYDPRSAQARAVASLHAKCIVVDLVRTLVTSANFTDRGQTRNVELGVLVEDRDFAAQVAAQWRSLAEAGVLARIVPGS